MEKIGKGGKPTEKEVLSHTFECVPEPLKLKDDSFYFLLKR